MWPIRFSCVHFCIFCLLFLIIHQNALQAAPVQHLEAHSQGAHESLKEPQVEFLWTNRTGYGSGSSLGLPTGLRRKSSQQVRGEKTPIVQPPRKKNQESDKPGRSAGKQRPIEDLSKEIFPSLPETAPAHRSQHSRVTHESLKEPHVEFQGPNKTDDNTDRVGTWKSGSGSSKGLPSGLHHKSSQQVRKIKPPIVHSARKKDQDSDKRVRSREKQRPIEDLSKEIFPSLPEASPADRSQHSRVTHESLMEPHVEFQGPNKTDDSTDRVETRKSGSGSSMVLPTGLPRKSSQQVREKKPPIVLSPRKKNQESDNPGRSAGKQRPIDDLSFRAGKEVTTNRRPKELTIPLAREMMGNLARRMKNPWAVTYGDVWHDTRLAAAQLSRMPRIHLVSSPRVDYYPDDAKLVSVCNTKSTLYYSYHFKWIQKTSWKWVARHVYEKPFDFRRISNEARESLHDQECHDFKKRKTSVLEHLDCTLRAYQEMEYRMPEYPKRQNG